ncbi:hypothetical protein BN424_2654 [Carnobacterium maltaromaticum LMA28]|uniref:Uncharacterized protein n=1 Tax=Carnobacterium maltaromaticum LMA28 TaxID=1234679 RepID=K8EJQ6_CARML|nr:hypothetical protein [Carnobacterium maltaromaticum]CCO12093.2 hypothetical protein BN424_2654 [Carnobacterium maltaromaticum LMA28]
MIKTKPEALKELKYLCSLIQLNLETLVESTSLDIPSSPNIKKKELASISSLLDSYHDACKIILTTWETNRVNEIDSYLFKANFFWLSYQKYYENTTQDKLNRLKDLFDALKIHYKKI